MPIVLNNSIGSISFRDALQATVLGADSLVIAVSYIQVGGWELFKEIADQVDMTRVQILCTDQMGITHPAAIRRAIDSGAQIRNFTGKSTYHPKAFLSKNPLGESLRCLIGSANLSTSAFTSSVECGFLSEDRAELTKMSRWFDDIFVRSGEEFTPNALHRMEARWKLAAAARARVSLLDNRQGNESRGDSGELDALEDVLSTIQLPIGLLNLDYAGNNIRNIRKAREVLADLPHASSKQKSELKLLGFLSQGELTALGGAALTCQSNDDFAKLWCGWLRGSIDEELTLINERLPVAKRVLSTFWKLNPEVREYFLSNAQSPIDRRLLQTIELLCNGKSLVSDLSLDNVRALSALLDSDNVPAYIRDEIRDYFLNKGTRSWDTLDRRTVPLAWRSARLSL